MRERSGEIEQATLARVQAVADPSAIEDPEYALGLKDAVLAALDYAISAFERGGHEHSPVPGKLLAQARAAARNGVPLDTVLRRYSAGYSLLADFLIREATGESSVTEEELQRALRADAAVFDRLIAAVSEAYTREAEDQPGGPVRRRAELTRMLLDGEPADVTELRYRLEGWHVGVLACGPGAVEAISDLAVALGRALLLVRPDEASIWAWLGGRTRPSGREILSLAERSLPGEVLLALGEPEEGVDGWRLTHRQAKAAMAVARRGSRRVRYAEVALLAAALGDEVLASSLHKLFVTPLEGGRDGGRAMLRTAAAYLAAGRNVSAAASELGVNRKTVTLHLRSIEEKIGGPIDGCAAELETAIKLRELTQNDNSSFLE